MRTRAHFMTAAAMFVMCVGLGSLADAALRRAVSWIADSGAGTSPRLDLTFRSGVHALGIRNLTDVTWSSCVVTVDGGYVSPVLTIRPRGLATIPYAILSIGEQSLGDDEGFGRALRSTAIECTDPDQQREFAVLR